MGCHVRVSLLLLCIQFSVRNIAYPVSAGTLVSDVSLGGNRCDILPILARSDWRRAAPLHSLLATLQWSHDHVGGCGRGHGFTALHSRVHVAASHHLVTRGVVSQLISVVCKLCCMLSKHRYGTSIAQGGVASRPGMAFTNIISRNIQYPIYNFGFSGNVRVV